MQGDETKIEHVFSRVADALAQVEKTMVLQKKKYKSIKLSSII